MTDIDKKDRSGMLQSGETKTAAVKKEDAALKPEKKDIGMGGPLMYVGPTIAGIGIQNRVYTEIPAEAAERAKEIPEVGLLFIPVRDHPLASRMLRERTGYIYDAYCKVAEFRRGGDGV